MTSEEMERTMAFILEQQAQLTATVGTLAEKVDGLAEKVDRTADGVKALLAIATIHDQEINALREASLVTAAATDARIEALSAQMEAQAEAGRATDERLSALVNVVEQMIGGRRGREG